MPEVRQNGFGVAERRVEFLRAAGICGDVGHSRQRQFVTDAGIVDAERRREDAVAADGVSEGWRKGNYGHDGAKGAGESQRSLRKHGSRLDLIEKRETARILERIVASRLGQVRRKSAAPAAARKRPAASRRRVNRGQRT